MKDPWKRTFFAALLAGLLAALLSLIFLRLVHGQRADAAERRALMEAAARQPEALSVLPPRQPFPARKPFI